VAEQAVRLVVHGVVQGVGFRWFVARSAEGLGVRGWVSNLADGSVEVVAAADDARLTQLEQRVRAGPRLARVERVEKTDIPHEQVAANSFEIR
jgi:acylphosphatase